MEHLPLEEKVTRKSKITKRELAAVLRESVFAPNKPGPLKVIMDVGDTRYYRQRALELVTLSLETPTKEQCAYYLEQAITLLAVAKHIICQKENSKIKNELMKGKLTQMDACGFYINQPTVKEKLIDAAVDNVSQKVEDEILVKSGKLQKKKWPN